MSYPLTEKRPRKTKGRVLQRDGRHCNLRALMWLLKTAVSFRSLLTSFWDEPMSNLKPGKTAGLGSAFRENGKAGDLLREVPWRGESPGLKLKCQGEDADFSEFLLQAVQNITTPTMRPHLKLNNGAEGTASPVAERDRELVSWEEQVSFGDASAFSRTGGCSSSKAMSCSSTSPVPPTLDCCS